MALAMFWQCKRRNQQAKQLQSRQGLHKAQKKLRSLSQSSEDMQD
jgi:hypothetical protein